LRHYEKKKAFRKKKGISIGRGRGKTLRLSEKGTRRPRPSEKDRAQRGVEGELLYSSAKRKESRDDTSPPRRKDRLSYYLSEKRIPPPSVEKRGTDVSEKKGKKFSPSLKREKSARVISSEKSQEKRRPSSRVEKRYAILESYGLRNGLEKRPLQSLYQKVSSKEDASFLE